MLSDILAVPTERTRSIGNEKGFENFMKNYGKLDDMNIKNVSKKALKVEFPLLFEPVNKALLPRAEKRTTEIGPNLFLMEALFKFRKKIFQLLSLSI